MKLCYFSSEWIILLHFNYNKNKTVKYEVELWVCNVCAIWQRCPYVSFTLQMANVQLILSLPTNFFTVNWIHTYVLSSYNIFANGTRGIKYQKLLCMKTHIRQWFSIFWVDLDYVMVLITLPNSSGKYV
jgi:hypothetical protein